MVSEVGGGDDRIVAVDFVGFGADHTVETGDLIGAGWTPLIDVACFRAELITIQWKECHEIVK